MGIIIWNDSFSVSNNDFDNHHKKLISYINQLFESMQKGKGKETAAGLIKELHDYSVYHFSKEEEKLSSVNYPKLDEQKMAHAIYIKKIEEFQTKLKEGDLFLSVDMLEFLSNWLQDHILKMDKEYKNYIS
ncbi:MAG: hemerythrin family protein [Spirochaetales bacterium]|jgi:hemerythrin|nr:bacteriohemerythrin [Exilispira sp.]NMC68003.1 hemerythrin family protein [Spirochaetales bacterium]